MNVYSTTNQAGAEGETPNLEDAVWVEDGTHDGEPSYKSVVGETTYWLFYDDGHWGIAATKGDWSGGYFDRHNANPVGSYQTGGAWTGTIDVALAGVQSAWQWELIRRAVDVAYIAPVGRREKKNWQLLRFRSSTAPFISQLGETATDLTAYNGGITETISVPEEEVGGEAATGIYFSGNTPFSAKDDTLWLPTGKTSYGSPIYAPSSELPGTADKVNLMYIGIWSGTAGYWVVAECTAAQKTNGDPLGSGAAPHTRVSQYDSSVQIGGHTGRFSSVAGRAVNAATATGNFVGSYDLSAATYLFDGYTIRLECVADVQTYPNTGCPWHMQKQTWALRTEWR